MLFTLFLYLFLYNSINATDNCSHVHFSGTGTVLFYPTDVYKSCWSHEELALLTARLILEDTIPNPRSITIKCNEDIDDLVEYFKMVIETIRDKTKARKRHIMLLALTDLLGGFLHYAFIPVARRAYYWGAIDFLYMEKVLQFYEEIKWFLRTNGQGWTRPMLVHKDVPVPIIDMNTLNSVSKSGNGSCHNLLFYEHEPLKSRKKRASINFEKGVYFPLPFFDAKTRPTAIAVPLRHYSIRNIESKKASYVIMKYFVAAEQCLREKKVTTNMVKKFQNNLFTWIATDVIPKLNDDKFYSAFGGILRVQNTLKALGAQMETKPCNVEESEENIEAVPGVGCNSQRNKMLLIAMLVIIVAWFLIGSCFICYRMKNNQTDDQTKTDSLSTSCSSSRWSSMFSSKTDKQLCKCCESTLSSTQAGEFSSTSEYDSEKLGKRRRNGKTFKKKTQNTPCECPSNGVAIIDAKNSMKLLPSIAELSESSMKKDMQQQNGSFRKISFAKQSSRSGGRVVKACAPPWAQSKNTIPCPILSKVSSTSKMTPVGEDSLQDKLDKLSKNQSDQSKNVTTSSNTPMEDLKNNGAPDSLGYSSDEKIKEEMQDAPLQGGEAQIFYEYKTGHSACHSSVSGNYDLFRKSIAEPHKPYIFGYDFQTTSSSELSDDDDNGDIES